jgi:Spy/CpxP family protein refolding chaperone
MKNIRVLAVIAILIGAATFATTEYTIVTSALAQATDNATMGGNMTGGNMTGGNMTGGNMTDAAGTISGRTG